MNTLNAYFDPDTPADFIMITRADSAMMYGSTFVTTARFTNAANCSLSDGEIVISASSDCTTAITIIPVTGAPIRFTLVKNAGNILSSAAALPVWAIVNCQPSSEPRHAMTARAMMIDPTNGLNICA